MLRWMGGGRFGGPIAIGLAAEVDVGWRVGRC